MEIVQSGRTQKILYDNREGVIDVNELFGGMTPELPYQNEKTGQNNLQKAYLAITKYKVPFGVSRSRDAGRGLDRYIQEFNAKSRHVRAAIYVDWAHVQSA